MYNSLLRFEHVSTDFESYSNLKDFNIDIPMGHIVGLIPLNDTGFDVLTKLMQMNMSISKGKIYYNDELVNSPYGRLVSRNSISIIDSSNRLVKSLSVQDNVFLTASHDRTDVVIPKKRQKIQLEWLLSEYEIDMKKVRSCEKLTEDKRCMVEIMRAIVNESKLIILGGLSSFLTEGEFKKVDSLIRRLNHINYSFMYICNDYDEAIKISDRVVFLKDGTDIKTLWKNNFFRKINMESISGLYSYGDKNMEDRPFHCKEKMLQIKNVYSDELTNFSLEAKRGECVVLKANSLVQKEMIELLLRRKKIVKGEILVEQKSLYDYSKRELYPMKVSLIRAYAIRTMPLYDLSYLDNLVIGVHRKMGSILISGKIQRSLKEEAYQLLGEKTKTENICTMSQMELYEMIYNKIILLRPALVIIEQPCLEAEYNTRIYIHGLIHQILEKGVTVLITSSTYANYLAIADRIVEVHKKKVIHVYEREDFGTLKNL